MLIHQLRAIKQSCLRSISICPLSGPSIHSHPHHSSINPALHQTVFFTQLWSACNCLRLWTLNLLLFQQKTDLGGFLCLSNHPLITTILFTPSLTALLCIWDERRKLRPHPSISDPAITNPITQSLLPTLYSPAFLFATCQKPVITESAARHGWEYQSAFSESLIHLTGTVCSRLTQRLIQCRHMPQASPSLSSHLQGSWVVP